MKLARMVRYDPSLAVEERAARMEDMARGIAESADVFGEVAACIKASTVYACIPGMFSPDKANRDIVIRVRRAQLTALRRLSELSVTDAVLADNLRSTYGTTDPAAWEADRLLHSPHPGLSVWREDAAYVAMLRTFATGEGSDLR